MWTHVVQTMLFKGQLYTEKNNSFTILMSRNKQCKCETNISKIKF